MATLLSYDIDDYTTSGFDIPWPLYKMICALAHWCLHDPSAINEGDERLFFLTRKDLQRHMVTMMRPKAAEEMSQAVSTAENNPVGGPNDFIDPAIDPAGADDFIDPAEQLFPMISPHRQEQRCPVTSLMTSLMTSMSTSQHVEFLGSRHQPHLLLIQRRLTHLPSPTTVTRLPTSSSQRLLEPTQLKPNFFSGVLLYLDGLLCLPASASYI